MELSAKIYVILRKFYLLNKFDTELNFTRGFFKPSNGLLIIVSSDAGFASFDFVAISMGTRKNDSTRFFICSTKSPSKWT